MTKQVYRVIDGHAVNIGQQRKRRDARHQARMARLKPTKVDDITLESQANQHVVDMGLTHGLPFGLPGKRSSLDVLI